MTVRPPFEPFSVGKYQAQQLLGEGACGNVYRARVEGTGGRPTRFVALKVLHPQCARVHDLLLAQARKVMQLKSRNVVRIGQADKLAGHSCIVMEVVDGMDLSRFLSTGKGRLPLPLAAYVSWCVLRGLSHALSRPGDDGAPLGLTHGGLKPSNVLLRRDGTVVVTGFGVARALALLPNTVSGRLRSLGPHAAPEVRSRGASDTRADVYGAAALLWECATGAPRVQEDNGGDDAFSSPAESLLGAELHAVLDQAMAQDPAARPPNPPALAKALTPFMTGHLPESLAAWLGRLVRTALGEEGPAEEDPNHTMMLDATTGIRSAVLAEAAPLSQATTGVTTGVNTNITADLTSDVTGPESPVLPPHNEVVAGDLEEDAAAALAMAGLDESPAPPPAVADPPSGVFAAVPTTQPGSTGLREEKTGVSQLTTLEELFAMVDDPQALLGLESVEDSQPPRARVAPPPPTVVPAQQRKPGTWTGRPFTFADLGFPPTPLAGRDVLAALRVRTVSRECSVTAVDTPPRTGTQLGSLLALDHLSLFPGLGAEPRHKGTTNTDRLDRLTSAYHTQKSTGVFSLLGPRPEQYAALYVVDGWLQYACVSDAQDCLLEVLEPLQAAPDSTVNLLVALVVVDGLGLAESLVRLRVMDASTLAGAMVSFTHARLARVMEWRQCRFEFRPDVRLPYPLPVPQDPMGSFAGAVVR